MISFKHISRGAILSVSLALITFSPAGAQPKQGMNKTVFENDKVAVEDTILKPGETLPSRDRGGMIYYYISGGKVERTFADGTKETVTRKAGQAMVNTEKRPYAVANVGTTTAHVIAIKLK
ncbi:MAG TPA: hypothetical protein VMO78_07265 [Rhizomicrobium sp.]|nr:hypothetical protein [Rhizomicrobium sp.]